MTNPPTVQSESCPSLDEVVRRASEIATLPQVALHIIDVVNDPNSGAGDLKEVLEGDAALSSRVLRCVNSSAYATRTEITNLQQAIAYLGVQQIRNLAVAASASKLFAGDEKIGPYNRAGLWQHLVAVGVCSRLLAMRLRLSDFEDVFLAGLLHDIGIVLEDQGMHNHFVRLTACLKEKQALPEAERAHFGFDHTMLGEVVAKNWRFPDSVIAAIRYHHNAAGYRGEYLKMVQCVEVANLICSLKGMSSVGVNRVAFPQQAIRGLSLTKDDIQVLAEDLDRELTLNKNLLRM